MLEVEGKTESHAGVLTIGRTWTSAENFKALIAGNLCHGLHIDVLCYSHLLEAAEGTVSHRAIIIEIDAPSAVDESLALVEKIRADNSKTTIFVVITCTGTYSKIKYYLAGADHCIKLAVDAIDKPNALSEFFKSPQRESEVHLVLDQARMCLHGAGRKLDISFVEMKVLEALINTKTHILSHDEIASAMGLNTHFYDSRALEKAISRLRNKIKDSYETNAIQSIRGYGYRLSRGLISPV